MCYIPHGSSPTVPSVLRILLPLCYIVGLFLLSSIPGDISDETAIGAAFQWLPPTWQNVLHIPLFAGLTLVLAWALPPDHRAWTVVALVLASLLGIVNELYQASVPGRYSSAGDVLLNVLGASLAALWIWSMRRSDTGWR